MDPSEPTPDIDPRTSEDCLFLDIFTPKQLFYQGYHAPVLFWIDGGGYTVGSKDAFFFTPEGLYNVTQSEFVVVSINYRLGAFGFLAGSVVREEGILNTGLLDQRFALEWVKLHIEKFGGDPLKVTIMGESAGGGSVMHHIAAYGGSHGAPFNLAILQSPSWFSGLTPKIQDANTQTFLRYLNVTTLEEARIPDDSYIPDFPAELFASGRYTHGLRILTGHNFDEELIITNPIVTDDASYI
ncbi:Alpha/Beta hydrolase protein [Flagelloscypha sp. PMI_526]|nr:Alpha/Beta hydrolase protein [Flagelloscypha sp. PMI_526]